MTGVVFFLSESKFIYVIWTAPIIMQEELFGIVLLMLLRTTALLCSEKKYSLCLDSTVGYCIPGAFWKAASFLNGVVLICVYHQLLSLASYYFQ